MSNKIFKKRGHIQNRINQFLSLFEKNKDDKKKLRELEMRLLQPTPIPQYKGPKVATKQFNKRSIMVAMPDASGIKKWAKHFKVNQYVKNNTWDIDFLLEIFNLLDSGRLHWDSQKKKFYLHLKTEH